VSNVCHCSWIRFRQCVAPALLLAFLSTVAFAQSHDRTHPTPLGPGTNKANIDSFEGPHYYYFFAGPGHIDVDFAFKESGLIGNPYRQLLNFDFLKDDGSVESHNHLTSFNDTARLRTGGELTHHKRFVLRVMPQPALVKLGGYYEITVAGAVEFEGTTVGGGIRAQQSESLVKPGGALVTPGGPLVTPGGPLVQPGGPLVQSGGPLVKSGGPLVTPGGPLVKHVGPLLVAESAKEMRVTLPADILFDFNQAVIRSDAIPALTQAATLIKEKRRGVVAVEGYTDSVGNETYNQRLSQQRAQAVTDWFVRNGGLARSGFSVEAFGARRPVAPNTHPNGTDNPEGRQRNRRVELVIQK
jgi:outer membrane protein OmpA-like peptidoglycan-associated protein